MRWYLAPLVYMLLLLMLPSVLLPCVNHFDDFSFVDVIIHPLLLRDGLLQQLLASILLGARCAF